MTETKNETRDIEINVKECSTKEGKKFNVFKAVQKNGRFIDCKFRRDVKDLPTEICIINVDTKEMNVDRNRKYPVLWVKKINSILPIDKGSNADESKVENDLF